MIRHFSIGAEDPERVANAIAELFQARVTRFPYIPGSFMVLAGDGHGTGIEVYPLDTALRLDEQGKLQPGTQPEPQRHGAFHAAISVRASQAQIEAIGEREGWRVARVQRGPFDFVELWLENRLMLELFPPELEPAWDRMTGPPRNFGQGSSGSPG